MWHSRPPRDPPLHGKYHLKFPFWLLAYLPYQHCHINICRCMGWVDKAKILITLLIVRRGAMSMGWFQKKNAFFDIEGQFEVQIIGISEEIHSFCWQNAPLKRCQKIWAGASPPHSGNAKKNGFFSLETVTLSNSHVWHEKSSCQQKRWQTLSALHFLLVSIITSRAFAYF